MSRTTVSALLAGILLWGSPPTAVADPVIFGFEGSCVTSAGEGCGAFGLEEGNTVTGRLSLDASLVVPGDRLILNPSTVSFDLFFAFGDLVISNQDIGDAAFEVFFLPPDATHLNTLSAPLPPGPFTSGSKFLLLFANRVDATRVFALTRDEAFAVGAWTQQPAPIPEPATVALLAIGLAMVGARHRRRRAR